MATASIFLVDTSPLAVPPGCGCCINCGCSGFCGLTQFCGANTTATFHGFDEDVAARNPSYIMTALGLLSGTPIYSILDGISVTGSTAYSTLRYYYRDRVLSASIPNDSDPRYSTVRSVWNDAVTTLIADSGGVGCWWLPVIPATSDGTAFSFSVIERLSMSTECTAFDGTVAFLAEYSIEVQMTYGDSSYSYWRAERASQHPLATVATCSPIYFPVTLAPTDSWGGFYRNEFYTPGHGACAISIRSPLIDFGGSVEIGP